MPHLSPGDWSSRKHDVRTATRADEVEFRALKESSSSLTEALHDERVEGTELDELKEIRVEKWLKRSETADERIAEVSVELRRRAQALGARWPFDLDGNVLRFRRATPARVYEFCLSVARSPSLTTRPFDRLPPAFENMCVFLMRGWLGQNGVGLRTGWPREKDQPTRAKELFGRVNRMTGGHEWRWAPDPELPEDPSPSHLKEAKLDLLTWLSMPDGMGHVYFAGQCACGLEDMEDKARELTVVGLRQWVKPPCWVEMVRSFFIPFHLPPHRLAEITRLGGATFDRTRLTLIAANTVNQNVRQHLKKLLQPLIDLVVSR
jgi:hypothetical protein